MTKYNKENITSDIARAIVTSMYSVSISLLLLVILMGIFMYPNLNSYPTIIVYVGVYFFLPGTLLNLFIVTIILKFKYFKIISNIFSNYRLIFLIIAFLFILLFLPLNSSWIYSLMQFFALMLAVNLTCIYFKKPN